MTTKRSKAKYKGLDKSVNTRVRKELLDFDYLEKLSPKERMWLSNFMQEYAGADFNHAGAKLHRSAKAKKSVYDANNARNRDAFAITKSIGLLKGLKREDTGRQDMISSKEQNKQPGMSGARSTLPNETEDVMVAVLDHHNSRRRSRR